MVENTGIYIRVSTEDQAKDGFSIAAQKDKLTKYADVNDWNIYDYYIDDGISGKNVVDRPEMNRLLKDVKNGKVNNILVYKLDRLTRSLLNLMELINLFEEQKCSLNSQTERLDTSNAVGRMFVKIIGTFAEFERENLAERVSLGYEQKTREGNYTNTNGVFGYNYIKGQKGLEVNEFEAEYVRKIYELYVDGMSYYKIAIKFNEEKVPTKRGGKWSMSTIRSILTNPLYIGRIRYGVSKKLESRSFEKDGNDIVPILDKGLWEKANKLSSKRRKYTPRRYPSENTYFFRTLRCAKCGGKMSARQQKQGNNMYISYFCNNSHMHTCDAVGFSHKKMELAFLGYLDHYEDMIPDERIIETKPKKNSSSELKQKYQKELQKLDNKSRDLRKLFVEDTLTLDDYKSLIEEIKLKCQTITEKINNIVDDEEEKAISYTDVENIVNNIKLNWMNLNNKERLQFLETFVDKINVDKNDDDINIKNIQFQV